MIVPPRRLALTILALLLSNATDRPRAWAFTIALITDEPSKADASKVSRAFLATPPFDRIEDFKIEILYIPEATLACRQERDRYLACDSAKALEAGKKVSADHVAILHHSSVWAGGGSTSVSMATSGMPPKTLIHEFLHGLGFSDEYRYQYADKTALSCGEFRTPNLTVFRELPSYASDEEAKRIHAKDIPWFDSIAPSTPITHGGHLGTPIHGVVGIYPANLCPPETIQPMKQWKPVEEVSVMESMEKGTIPSVYWPYIAKKLGTRLRTTTAPTATGTTGPVPQAD